MAPKNKPPAALIRVTAVLPGDEVKTSSKAKTVSVKQRTRQDDQVVLTFSNSDVRTYHHEDRIILIWRPEDQNL